MHGRDHAGGTDACANAAGNSNPYSDSSRCGGGIPGRKSAKLSDDSPPSLIITAITRIVEAVSVEAPSIQYHWNICSVARWTSVDRLNQRQTLPERKFSALNNVMPKSIPTTSGLIQRVCGLNASTNPYRP